MPKTQFVTVTVPLELPLDLVHQIDVEAHKIGVDIASLLSMQLIEAYDGKPLHQATPFDFDESPINTNGDSSILPQSHPHADAAAEPR